MFQMCCHIHSDQISESERIQQRSMFITKYTWIIQVCTDRSVRRSIIAQTLDSVLCLLTLLILLEVLLIFQSLPSSVDNDHGY